jgi:hypothetical protein
MRVHRQTLPHQSASRARLICARAIVPIDSAPLAGIAQVSQLITAAVR